MKRWATALVALAAFGSPASAQTTLTDHAFTPSMSAQISSLAQGEVSAGRTPGLAIGVVEDGRVVYSRGFGFANTDQHVRAEPDTEFYAGGVTMQFTAAAALMLAADGKLKLDDKIVKYVPELTIAADVTIEELLEQTSGLPDPALAPGISTDPTRSIKPGDLLAAINKLKLVATPGATYAENPLNYVLASIAIERASGEPLSDVLQQKIFLPLVMDRTFLAGDSGISPSHAIGYTRARNGIGFTPARPWDPAWLSGGRGLVSTVYDLAKWDIEMPVLVRVDAVRTMFTPSGTAGPAKYGMGWVIDQRGGKRFIWYGGQIPGYQAMNALLPDEHIAVIVLANVDSLHGGRVVNPEEIGARILDIVAPPPIALLDNTVVTRAKEWLERLAERHVDRTQLTQAFSDYLTDDLVSREDFAALGKLQTIVPISSTTEQNGDTLYEFLVRYPRARYHYKFAVSKDGKIDEIVLAD
jgi:CubicO group peptidase (beta-lactamase class C family)